jgi:Flp pilus assembly protein protease CpaA
MLKNMETNAALALDGNSRTWVARFRRVIAAPLLLWLLLALPALVQAQYTYTTSNNQITITGYTGADGVVVIPDTINGLPVAEIGERAFDSRSGVTSVTIPNSVIRIGFAAFVSCTGLTSMTIANSVTTIESFAFAYCTGLTNVTIPSRVTTLGSYAFTHCTGLTSVTIPNGFISLGYTAFYSCTGLTSVTIPNSVTRIEFGALAYCTGLTSITIPNSVSSIGDKAFFLCTGLSAVIFRGNAPGSGAGVFFGADSATVYYLPGTTGWGVTFAGRSTKLLLPPTLLIPPRTQTVEVGSVASFSVRAVSSVKPTYRWFKDNVPVGPDTTNPPLVLPNVQPNQAGVYTVVVANAGGAVTSAPVTLNVIPPVPRRTVPAIQLNGTPGSLLHLEQLDALTPPANWQPLAEVSLTGAEEFYFDLTVSGSAQRFYRAAQTEVTGTIPSLSLSRVPALTLTGNVGDSVRVDGINRFGATDAWFPLGTVKLMSPTQLYFDTTAEGQPERLYRLVPVP